MKLNLLVYLIIFCLGVDGYSQNRIQEWDIEKITSIQIEFSLSNNEQEITIFDTAEDIDKIISFLKNVEFKEFVNSNINTLEKVNDKSYKIVFKGQRDQVYLFKNFAFIGKTRFIIDKKVIEDFGKLINQLNI